MLQSEPGAVLEALGPALRDTTAITRWASCVQEAAAALGWQNVRTTHRHHANGITLALTAAPDQLFTATEVNEWAWCVASDDHGFHAPGHAIAADAALAFYTLRLASKVESNPRLPALITAANTHELPVLWDDEMLSIGLGVHSRAWPITALPTPDDVPWSSLSRIPTALVTGSNGKTTTVRLLAAFLRAQGKVTGHSCTDGLFIDGTTLDSGDYSGPAGARSILRDPRVQAAVLETARGGMLRRGLALAEADVAVITNISADHFGEYGIHDLDDLAAAKLTLARAVQAHGRLVLNADDPRLRAAGLERERVDWFSLDLDAALKTLPMRSDTRLCGLRDGNLCLHERGETTVMLPIADIPLGLGGHARYNLANAAGAVLAARVMDVPIATLQEVSRHFGKQHADNPGRLQQWRFGGITVLLDYAHNPEGLDGLLQIAQQIRGDGRLALLLGQAGNRDDTQIRALAQTAARHRPDLVVLKDLDGYLRGRVEGEVAALLRSELHSAGMSDEALPVRLRELDAARTALAWAKRGDVLVLPVHALSAKQDVGALLDALQAQDWKAGDVLPL